MAGYVDPATGQYIPDSFADALDLPGPTEVNPAAVAKSTAALVKEKVAGHKNTVSIDRARKEVAAAKKALGKKGLTSAQRAKLNAKIKARGAYISSQSAMRSASVKRQGVLQNSIYEAKGQYEKLLTGTNRDAYASLKSMFNQFGLGSLAPKIYEYAKNGLGADVISLLLQDTKEYKTRFAGNEVRAKNGMGVLTPAEYLSTEQAYRQILQDAGLPKGFYDSVTDFTDWISKDVSPTEIKGRVDMAVANSAMANPAAKQALKDLYGVDDSYVTAYFLDNKRSLPLLQKQSQAAQFGAEALKRGLTLDKNDLEDFVTAGLSLSGVSQGFQAVAEALPNIQAIAARYGETFTQHELSKDLIEGDATSSLGDGRLPSNKRKRLASQERALFSGFSGATPGGLSVGTQNT